MRGETDIQHAEAIPLNLAVVGKQYEKIKKSTCPLDSRQSLGLERL